MKQYDIVVEVRSCMNRQVTVYSPRYIDSIARTFVPDINLLKFNNMFQETFIWNYTLHSLTQE